MRVYGEQRKEAQLASPTRQASRHVCRMCNRRSCRPGGVKRGFLFVECSECGFVFAPAITARSLQEAYRKGYHGFRDGAPVEGWASEDFLGPAFDRLGRSRSLQILDFGAGESRMPRRLRARGHRVVAVDVAPPLEPHPDRLTGDLLSLRLDPDQFDLTYAFQVFEHLPEPRPILKELLRLTKPGGAVLVHTDMETPEREAGLARWSYVSPPDHCAFFRHRTFQVCLAGTPHRLIWRDPKAMLIGVGPSA